jgi:hypothetical protein
VHEGLSDTSRVEPDDNGREDHHCAVVSGALLVASSQPTPLFEPIDAPFHDVATCVDRPVEGERAAGPHGTPRPLIRALGYDMWDLPLAQQVPTPGIAVALVGNDPVWAGARPPPPIGAWDPDAVEHEGQLRTVMPVSWRDHDGERSSFAVTGEMELGGQPSTAAPESLVGWVVDPFFSSARLGRRLAPLAW